MKEIIHGGAWVQVDDKEIKDNKGQQWEAYHWVRDKKRRKFHYPNWDKVPKSYYVTQYGFFDSATPLKNFFKGIFYRLEYWQGALRDIIWKIRNGHSSEIREYRLRQQ